MPLQVLMCQPVSLPWIVPLATLQLLHRTASFQSRLIIFSAAVLLSLRPPLPVGDSSSHPLGYIITDYSSSPKFSHHVQIFAPTVYCLWTSPLVRTHETTGLQIPRDDPSLLSEESHLLVSPYHRILLDEAHRLLRYLPQAGYHQRLILARSNRHREQVHISHRHLLPTT